MINWYNAVFKDIKDSGITKILFNELYEKYRVAFKDNVNLFNDFLNYLEETKKIRIIRFDFDDDLIHSIEIL